MKSFTTIALLREVLASERNQGHTISFVPTMGNLHEGHLALIRAARQEADKVVVSIFINPMQFGANEDLDAYPRTLAKDTQMITDAGADYLFAPTAREMYPHGMSTQITIPVLSNVLCGASRPGHFQGVTTICTKLFNIVQPDVALFGEKDFQQLTIIRHMVEDLYVPTRIVGVQTGRAEDGLALSSRNMYLTAEERKIAPILYRNLEAAKNKIIAGERNYFNVEEEALDNLRQAGFRPDYFHVSNRATLEAPTPADEKLIILAAAQLGKSRLIDNCQLDLKLPNTRVKD